MTPAAVESVASSPLLDDWPAAARFASAQCSVQRSAALEVLFGRGQQSSQMTEPNSARSAGGADDEQRDGDVQLQDDEHNLQQQQQGDESPTAPALSSDSHPASNERHLAKGGSVREDDEKPAEESKQEQGSDSARVPQRSAGSRSQRHDGGDGDEAGSMDSAQGRADGGDLQEAAAEQLEELEPVTEQGSQTQAGSQSPPRDGEGAAETDGVGTNSYEAGHPERQMFDDDSGAEPHRAPESDPSAVARRRNSQMEPISSPAASATTLVSSSAAAAAMSVCSGEGLDTAVQARLLSQCRAQEATIRRMAAQIAALEERQAELALGHAREPGAQPVSSQSCSPPVLSCTLEERWAQDSCANTPTQVSHLPWLSEWSELYPPPPIPADDAERCRIVDELFILDSEEEDLYNDLCALARRMLGVQLVCIDIVAKDRIWFKASSIEHPKLAGFKTAPRKLAPCNYVVKKGGTLIIPDMLMDRTFQLNPLTKLDCRFYAGSPLTTKAGVHVGVFAVLDSRPRLPFGAREESILELMAATTVKQLEARKAHLQVVRMRDQFFANMSHELRTSLHGILGVTQLLSGTDMDPLQKEYVSDVQHQAHVLLRIVNDLLDFAKLNSDKLQITLAPSFVAVVLTRCCHKLQLVAARKHISLLLDLGDTIDGRSVAMLDGHRLRQVLTNLVDNSVKFSSPGSAIVVRAYVANSRPLPLTSGGQDIPVPEVAETLFLCFSVCDHGRGVSPSLLPHLFDAFSQEDATSARAHGGSGLGLYISRRLALLMGGNLWLQHSVQGQGTTMFGYVTATLPSSQPLSWQADSDIRTAEDTKILGGVSSAPALLPHRPQRPSPAGDAALPPSTLLTNERGPPSAETPAMAASTSGNALRVLVVDDQALNIKIATRLLESLGHRVASALGGCGALEQIAKQPFDLILMDVQMPQMSGYECTKTIRHLEQQHSLPFGRRSDVSQPASSSSIISRPRIPIVAFTASVMPEDRALCVASGMDDVLTKPVSLKSLQTLLQRIQQR